MKKYISVLNKLMRKVKRGPGSRHPQGRQTALGWFPQPGGGGSSRTSRCLGQNKYCTCGLYHGQKRACSPATFWPSIQPIFNSGLRLSAFGRELGSSEPPAATVSLASPLSPAPEGSGTAHMLPASQPPVPEGEAHSPWAPTIGSPSARAQGCGRTSRGRRAHRYRGNGARRVVLEGRRPQTGTQEGCAWV